MLNVNIENVSNNQDQSIVNAFNQMLELYQDNNINSLWDEIKEAKFKYHVIGKGGNHIWIARKDNCERVALIN